jgi:hypothetical protein
MPFQMEHLSPANSATVYKNARQEIDRGPNSLFAESSHRGDAAIWTFPEGTERL